jgi:uncharacterized small protein (DUF1192 family)
MKVTCTFKHTLFAFSSNSSAGYTCRVKSITDLDRPGLRLIGEHEEGRSDRDVVGVKIENIKELTKFPRGFGNIFPNLRFIEVNRCSITTLKREDLVDVGNLQGLWLSENQITALQNDLFETVQGLQYISFYKNHLKYIGSNLLTPLKNLKQANFKDNTCINVNYLGEPDELRLLKSEIITKCSFPVAATAGTGTLGSNALKDLVARMAYMEEELGRLKAEGRQKDARIKTLEDKVKGISADLEEAKEKLSIIY